MKSVLIVINDMKIGGAQKSLLSFLQALDSAGQLDENEIHLLPMNPTGEFLSMVPEKVIVEQPANVIRWLGTRLNPKLMVKHFSLRGLLGELRWILQSRVLAKKDELNLPQRLWRCWKGLVPACKEHYDTAIAYIDGTASYYVMDKVSADRKVLWLHSDYELQGYDPAFDDPYYAACHAVVTVSDECREKVLAALPQHQQKVSVLQNITSWQMIEAQSRKGDCPEFEQADGLKLLSVGRLHWQKGMDLAIEAARKLRDAGIPFLWLVAGEGSERPKLEAMIAQYGLESCFRLIGSRQNPYAYMRECDILVQPSRVEGKSIVLDEAKMLETLIVVTDYPTAVDAVCHGETGWVTAMSGDAICEGILTLARDEELRARIRSALHLLPKGNEEELRKYQDMML